MEVQQTQPVLLSGAYQPGSAFLLAMAPLVLGYSD
jgi:hypothetical protein